MEEDLEELTRKMMEGMEGGEADQTEDLGECERNREWIEEEEDDKMEGWGDRAEPELPKLTNEQFL